MSTHKSLYTAAAAAEAVAEEEEVKLRWNKETIKKEVVNIIELLLLLLLLLHPFNSLFSRTTWLSRHQKGKPFWILQVQEMMGWQWHQLDHMQIICTSLQTDNHASTSPLSFYRSDALPAAQPTVSKHWRQISKYHKTHVKINTNELILCPRKNGPPMHA